MAIDANAFHLALMGETIPLSAPPPSSVASLEGEPLDQKLQRVARKGLDAAEELLDLPLAAIEENGPLIRAKTAAMQMAVTTQAKIEETKFKQQHKDDVFNRLLQIISEEKDKLGLHPTEG